jgi:hypothetical protein
VYVQASSHTQEQCPTVSGSSECKSSSVLDTVNTTRGVPQQLHWLHFKSSYVANTSTQAQPQQKQGLFVRPCLHMRSHSDSCRGAPTTASVCVGFLKHSDTVPYHLEFNKCRICSSGLAYTCAHTVITAEVATTAGTCASFLAQTETAPYCVRFKRVQEQLNARQENTARGVPQQLHKP